MSNEKDSSRLKKYKAIFKYEVRQKNIYIYAQWLGFICLVLNFVLGLETLIRTPHDSISVENADLYKYYMILGGFCLTNFLFMVITEIGLPLSLIPTPRAIDDRIGHGQQGVKIVRLGVFVVASIGKTVILILLVVVGGSYYGYGKLFIANGLPVLLVFELTTTLLYVIGEGMRSQTYTSSRLLGGSGVPRMTIYIIPGESA